jgi:hypothetical protein
MFGHHDKELQLNFAGADESLVMITHENGVCQTYPDLTRFPDSR